MKTGVQTTAEFQRGTGRRRLGRSITTLSAELERARSRFEATSARLAKERLLQIVPWWHLKFPTRTLAVRFGNGSAWVTIDDRMVHLFNGLDTEIYAKKRGGNRRDPHVRPSVFQPLQQALDDVDALTDDLRITCPDDLVIEPITPRNRRR